VLWKLGKSNFLFDLMIISSGLLFVLGYTSSDNANEIVTPKSISENIEKGKITTVAELSANSSQKAQILSGTTSPKSFPPISSELAQSASKDTLDSPSIPFSREGFYFRVCLKSLGIL